MIFFCFRNTIKSRWFRLFVGTCIVRNAGCIPWWVTVNYLYSLWHLGIWAFFFSSGELIVWVSEIEREHCFERDQNVILTKIQVFRSLSFGCRKNKFDLTYRFVYKVTSLTLKFNLQIKFQVYTYDLGPISFRNFVQLWWKFRSDRKKLGWLVGPHP